jgi:hypothetical protein
MTDLLTFLLVVATLGLVGVTAWSTRKLVTEGRDTRREERAERRRALIRAAVAEGVEYARAWFAVQPRRLTLGEKQRRVPLPGFKALAELIDNMDLPADVVAYLLWARGHTLDLRERYGSCIAGAEGAPAVNECRGIWDSTLDLVQSIALLVRAHAAADPELAPAVGGFAMGHWLVAQPGPPGGRELEHTQRMAMEGAPAWPSGIAYAGWSPASRDREGAETGERQRASLDALVAGRSAAFTGAESRSEA